MNLHLYIWYMLVFFALLACQKEDPDQHKSMSQETIQQEEPLRIVFLGNSITAGYGLRDPLQSFPSLLARRWEEENRSIKVINAGISGETAGGALERLDLILQYPIDIMVIELGINDYIQGFSKEAVSDHLRQIIKSTQTVYPGAIILLTDIQLSVLDPNVYALDYQEIFPQLAKEMSIELLPSYLQLVWTDSDLVMADRLHPNAEGYEVIAESVYSALEKFIR
jgi:acyl-CoA thioesterase-1